MKTSIVTTLNPKGQATIPKRVREILKIGAGDKIEFDIEDNGIKIRPILNLESAFGRVRPKHMPEDFKKLRKSFEEKVAEEVRKEV
ncbi:AbrB family transcriptional regulator [Candidatus Desantisbacteria bacterium CG07_land_8_20_14_0_80_39_15]|nr:MAG: AbrB family transcriptional regulator [Candidatus Desantisbacteria bacterium CG07_land_8_20_14_0_80_39_15]PIZ16769.1 MAG: AbrB family transcriptional regulator [Candidatus Desantisbacteria bacterium CG_4_10_14_0_8_um_filter_39_17]